MMLTLSFLLDFTYHKASTYIHSEHTCTEFMICELIVYTYEINVMGLYRRIFIAILLPNEILVKFPPDLVERPHQIDLLKIGANL